MDWLAFAREAGRGVFENIAIMAAIIFPLMLLMEMARDAQLLDRFSRKVSPVLKVFGMSGEASLPLLVGGVFGLAYGAGVIIESARSGRIAWRDLFLVNVFLSLCHSVIEDTALFIALGADPVVILGGRLVLAVVITYLVSRSGWLANMERGKLKVPVDG
ncbi:nucleoside recognition domain-containing protein [Desulfofundulus salinus]|uniref:Nucleoside recognition protein n=1 Tax=Desulfofundulus salinus TaxID=2419843 RepID=A0A494X4T4_9FIRM|nr:nucleoside recognition domain-containing protein [Desulfofundulus salinum]RKO68175.1 nucleoside recognition protein [Desulfofundulus salinum]